MLRAMSAYRVAVYCDACGRRVVAFVTGPLALGIGESLRQAIDIHQATAEHQRRTAPPDELHLP